MQGRAAGGAEPAALRLGARDFVEPEVARPGRHLLVGEIGRPAEGAAGPPLAVGAMAKGVEDGFALHLDAAGAAATMGLAGHGPAPPSAAGWPLAQPGPFA